jgi:two-component system nitrogen regulation sensor histidine kinase GlnL
MAQNNERLDAILDSVAVGIIAILGDDKIELQNAEASRILGTSSEFSVGRTLAESLGAKHPVTLLVAEALGAQRPVSSHACAIQPRLSSSSLVVDLAASPIGLDAAEGAVVTLRDRTIGRELEALVDQRSRSQLFAHLAAGIAHELGNPLSGIRGAAELLLGKLRTDDLRRFPELIRDETDRMRRLLGDLAELTRGGELSRRPTNLHRVLDNLIELHSHSKSWHEIEVRREYDPSIPELEIDSDRMAQAFLNLMRNAVQAMGGKGTLTLRTRVETNYQLSPDQRPVHMMRLDIEDTGPGIPAEHLPHVFTPFFTQTSGGTGLGLPIAQHWTVRHDGHIRVSSDPGGGARVRIRLPLRRQP